MEGTAQAKGNRQDPSLLLTKQTHPTDSGGAVLVVEEIQGLQRQQRRCNDRKQGEDGSNKIKRKREDRSGTHSPNLLFLQTPHTPNTPTHIFIRSPIFKGRNIK